MKNLKKYLLMAAVVALLGQGAWARSNNVRHEAVFVAKGETFTGDVSTDKSITVDGTLNGDAVAVGGSSVTVTGEVTGDLVSIGGPVHIPGSVKGDVSSIGGPVDVTGKVSGDIHTVGARVDLLGSAEVDGDIFSMGGSVNKGPKAVLRGDIKSFDLSILRTMLPRVLKAANYSEGESNWHQHSSWGNNNPWSNPNLWLVGGLVGLGLMVFFSMLATGIILLLIPAVFFPKHVEKTSAVIAADLWRTCGVGALILVCFFPALLVLTVSILGIPLIPFALLVFAAGGVLGLSAFSVVLQNRFFEGIKKAGPVSLSAKVATGYAIMAGLMFFGKIIPLVGGILSLLGFLLLMFGSMLGLGAVWLTRMGSQTGLPTATGQPAVPPPAQPAAVTPQQPPVIPPPAQ
jgi:cytoskeletal protein CcmA (bactofilin family)